ncbi:LLM class oxidoreductase [Actinomadura rudentiformis]|uniref:LLM class flavin-dependent oxidoreductase n=1 Tax=Actinomadura rudentiformis TaxID=359158 RepID=A0A6H9Z7E8_9ACTN|nr:LLM class flavin-dependent oxidoreductase [Actinomadura rudentiformis]KAB2349725.1 LLM class flavin-dependent oxidoreductase [Actinomadura rudentiformis]
MLTAMHGGAVTLAEAYPGRVILGLGGAGGDRPLTRLQDYLDEMDKAASRILPDVRYPRVLAALGPRAHRLARERAEGVHPFMQPVEHTEVARKALGPEGLLIPHQTLVLGTNATSSRGQMRALLAQGMRNIETPYTRNYRRLGYGDDDLADDRSDRLIDATLAWGDEKAIATRLHEHLEAGADHVLLHPLAPDLKSTVDQLERLAPQLNQQGHAHHRPDWSRAARSGLMASSAVARAGQIDIVTVRPSTCHSAGRSRKSLRPAAEATAYHSAHRPVRPVMRPKSCDGIASGPVSELPRWSASRQGSTPSRRNAFFVRDL